MSSVGTPWLWTGFAVFVVTALLVDFVVLNRQGAHRVGLREAGLWTLVWVAAALVFVGVLWGHLGGVSGEPVRERIADQKALQFLTGYLVEKALAMDNVFVFLMVFSHFAVPAELQKRVLMFAILGALVLRGGMILIGAWLVSEFHWVLYVFGAFLLLTGFKMARSAGQPAHFEQSALLAWLRKHLPFADDHDGDRFFTRQSGRWMATPLLLVLILIAVVDVVFAVDSIPAVFAITTNPFIVLTSNVFAILGLRAMYFLLADLQHRFHLLPYGLALILMVIGTKMLLIDVYKPPVAASLGLTAGILAVTVITSVLIPRPPKARPR